MWYLGPFVVSFLCYPFSCCYFSFVNNRDDHGVSINSFTISRSNAIHLTIARRKKKSDTSRISEIMAIFMNVSRSNVIHMIVATMVILCSHKLGC